MDKLSDTMKKIILAGIGAAATTTEKTKEIVDDLVKKGELTVEQGKVLNEELKHNVKKTFESKPQDVSEMLHSLTPEQLAALKEQLSAMESESADEEAGAEE
ncbi:MAG: phasin family protein [Clostridiales bacterium]|nr:phasin family protein [Clostridiales bacterium]